MNVGCFQLVNGALKPVQDPTEDGTNMAGYSLVLSTEQSVGVSGHVAVYGRDEKPSYYIDVMGTNESVAFFVADDLPQLVATLKEIGPLLALVESAQRSDDRDA